MDTYVETQIAPGDDICGEAVEFAAASLAAGRQTPAAERSDGPPPMATADAPPARCSELPSMVAEPGKENRPPVAHSGASDFPSRNAAQLTAPEDGVAEQLGNSAQQAAAGQQAVDAQAASARPEGSENDSHSAGQNRPAAAPSAAAGSPGEAGRATESDTAQQQQQQDKDSPGREPAAAVASPHVASQTHVPGSADKAASQRQEDGPAAGEEPQPPPADAAAEAGRRALSPEELLALDQLMPVGSGGA